MLKLSAMSNILHGFIYMVYVYSIYTYMYIDILEYIDVDDWN